VWVTDFGLAKLDDDRNLTRTGDVLGTLRYMAPETFAGQAETRSEIYSLGLTLYELLVFQPAFSHANPNRLIDQVMHSQIEPPRKLNPRIPVDLQTIILKAVDRDPGHRYQTAQEFADDLQRFLDDEPIRARRVSLPGRMLRWSRRNKGLTASISAILTLLVVGLIGTAVAAAHINHVAFSPSGQYLVTASDDNSARIWDAKTGKPVSPPLAHKNRVMHA
jgi:serine/threonine protein kinase